MAETVPIECPGMNCDAPEELGRQRRRLSQDLHAIRLWLTGLPD